MTGTRYEPYIRPFLAGAMLFYPLYFVAMAIVNLTPSALRSRELPEMTLTPLHVGPRMVGMDLPAFVLAAAVALLVARLSARFLSHAPLAASLWTASLALAAMRWPLAVAILPQAPSPLFLVLALFLFVVVAAGLSSTRNPMIVAGYGSAAAIYWMLYARSFLMGLTFVLATALAVAFAFFMLRRRVDRLDVSWKTVTVGLLAAASVFLFAKMAGAWLQAQRELRRESERREIAGALLPMARHEPYTREFFQKGVNLTAEWPVNYSPRAVAEIIERLEDYGVNAIALVPYGFAPERHSPEIRFPTRGGMEDPRDIEIIARLAKQKGFRVMIKPQVWLRRGFPGDIEMRDGGDVVSWFENYWRFLEFHARLAEGVRADLLCVGVEFVKMSRYEDRWRDLIARTREIYGGPLTYGATQGEEFETLRFWDALDFIGLNNYYPLPDNLDASEVVRKVEAVQRRFHKPVIFPEAGFTSTVRTHRAPWDDSRGEASMEAQAQAYEAVFQAFYRKPWFLGVYWWKVGANGVGGPDDRSHTPWGKPAMEVVARWYRNGGR
jgi:MFS family permease